MNTDSFAFSCHVLAVKKEGGGKEDEEEEEKWNGKSRGFDFAKRERHRERIEIKRARRARGGGEDTWRVQIFPAFDRNYLDPVF